MLFGSGTALLSWLLEIFGEHTIDPTSFGVLLTLSVSLLAVSLSEITATHTTDKQFVALVFLQIDAMESPD